MDILRTVKVTSPRKIGIGDRILLGRYTATVVKLLSDGFGGTDYMLCLDQYLDKSFSHENLLDQINDYLDCDLNFKDISELLIPQRINGKVYKFRVPYVGEFFTNDYECKLEKGFEPDTNKGFCTVWPEMRYARNRMAADDIDTSESAWLMNQDKSSKLQFANVHKACLYSSYGCAKKRVRPVFIIGTPILNFIVR